jgi:hypothetical protein
MADDFAGTQRGQEKKERHIVHVSSYGSIPDQFRGRIETVQFQIHDFVNLDGSVLTDEFMAHGRQWEVAVHPHNVRAKRDYVSVRIFGAGDSTDSNDDDNPTAYYKAVFRTNTMTKSTRAFNNEMEHFFFTKQEDFTRNECDAYGTFTIDVDLQVVTESPKKVWFPRSIELRKDDLLIQLYNSVDITGDVAFTVGKKDFRAHKCVLALEAKALYELIEVEESSSSPSNSLTVTTADNDGHNDHDDDDVSESTKNLVTKIVLTDGVDEAAFGSMLEFIYTGNISALQFEHESKKHRQKIPWTFIGSILVTADRFGCSNLKLYAESLLVASSPNRNNTVRLLLFADSHSCALLKEACMDAYSHNPTVVIKEDEPSWTKLQKSSKLLSELLLYSTIEFHRRHNNNINNKEGGDDDDDDDDRNAEEQHEEKYLDVSTLRDRLQEADVDVDGSREYLLKRYRKLIHGEEAIIADKNE